MELTDKQIKQISKSIAILDVKSYIAEHLLEYRQFLKEEKKKEQE